MEKKSISQIISVNDRVMDTRKRLEKTFSMIADCHVTIGGSYALKYHCEAFYEREVSDFDFILHVDEDKVEKIECFIRLLNRSIHVFSEAYMYNENLSFYWGYLLGKKVNVIIKPGKCCPCSNFEGLKDIIAIKREWCDKAIKQGKRPRYKDVADIATYEKWEADNDLPF